jgi:hypothetical protein
MKFLYYFFVFGNKAVFVFRIWTVFEEFYVVSLCMQMARSTTVTSYVHRVMI